MCRKAGRRARFATWNSGESRRNEKVRKWVLIAAAVVAVAVFCFIVFFAGGTGGRRSLTAKIRYFDGVCEMIELRGYQIVDGFARLDTAAGDRIYVGANNVNIIEEKVNR